MPCVTPLKCELLPSAGINDELFSVQARLGSLLGALLAPRGPVDLQGHATAVTVSFHHFEPGGVFFFRC